MLEICDITVNNFIYWENKKYSILYNAFSRSSNYIHLLQKAKYSLELYNLLFLPVQIIILECTNFPTINEGVIREILERLNKPLAIYTDGSKTNNTVGGSLCYSSDRSCQLIYFLQGNIYIFTAESLIITEALKLTLDKNTNKKVAFLTHSLSVLRTLEFGRFNYYGSITHKMKKVLEKLKTNDIWAMKQRSERIKIV